MNGKLLLAAADAKSFFGRCAAALKPGGLIFVKENICKEGFVVDKVTPSRLLFGARSLLCQGAHTSAFPCS